MSYTKRLQNEMNSLEKESDKCIPFDKFYIIKMKIEFGKYDFEDLKVWSKKLLTENSDHQPNAVYIYNSGVCLVYSSLKEGEHFLSGSHQFICSHYVSLFNNFLFKVCKDDQKIVVVCKIIHFNTQTQAISYISNEIYSNTQSILMKYSKGSITQRDILHKTFEELVHILKKKGIVWEDISKEERFGICFNLKRKRDKLMVVSLSENFDARENKKHLNFIFGN